VRARWLKPEFFNDKKIGMLGANPALVFEALWCMADDGGTALCNPELVKGQMFSFWPSMGLPEISEALERLAVVERIDRYSIDDDEYASIRHFRKHQKIHNPSSFRHPRPAQGVAGAKGERLRQEGGRTSENVSSPHILDSYTPRHLTTTGFQEVRKLYPKRAGGDNSADAEKQYLARLKSGETHEAIHAGTIRYAAYVRATGKEGTEFVKQMCTFLGKSRHYLEPWDIPAAKNGKRPDESPAEFQFRQLGYVR
jgi:hypothetical protein